MACAAGLLGDAFDTLNVLVCDQLDSMVRPSALVERVNSRMRPSLNRGTGQITPETFKLLMVSHTHRRDQSGNRPGQAPIDLWTGKPWPAPWWELIRQQGKPKQRVTDDALLSRPPLHVLLNNHRETAQQAMA